MTLDSKRWKRSKIVRSALAAVAVLSSGTAVASPPWEQTVATLSRADGQKVTVVHSYVDGILSVDPVQVVVRDAAGSTLDETPFSRDVLTSCADATCTVFRYDQAFAMTASEVFKIDDGKLVRINGIVPRVTGGLFHVTHHALGYTTAALVLVVISRALASFRRTHGWRRLAAAGMSLSLSFGWWYAVTELSRLSLPSAGVLGAMASLAVLQLRRSLTRSSPTDVGSV
jgi:hypothetical protein